MVDYHAISMANIAISAAHICWLPIGAATVLLIPDSLFDRIYDGLPWYWLVLIIVTPMLLCDAVIWPLVYRKTKEA